MKEFNYQFLDRRTGSLVMTGAKHATCQKSMETDLMVENPGLTNVYLVVQSTK